MGGQGGDRGFSVTIRCRSCRTDHEQGDFVMTYRTGIELGLENEVHGYF